MKCPKCHFDNPDDTLYCGKCATPLPSSKEIPATETLETPKEELTTGSIFAGRYQIIEELGKGGMGKVYKAIDKKLNEEVALKIIKPEIASDEKTLERFNNELKLARKIAHKNVGRMYELMEEKGTHFITMEYVPGQDLRGLIRQTGQLTAGTAVSIAKQVCEGLAEAHRLGVIHRDLKPSNIMIDKEGNARIMDFGIARSVSGKGITGAGVLVGTPEYMSPEQAEIKDVDQRSDIYSFGVILYEMVTGRVPFEGETPLGIAMKHKSEMPKDPRVLNAQIPEDLGRLILNCLEKDREKRYQSAGEVRSELENIEKGIPTAEKVIPKRKPLTSKEITVTFSLKRLLIPAVIVVALIIAAFAILKLFPPKKAVSFPSDKPSLAILYFENNTGDQSLEYLRSGLSEWLITDISQSKFINVLPGDRIFSILKKLDLLEAKKYSSEDISHVASEGGANHVLKGSYIKVGENFVITASLQNPQTGELLKSVKVECRGEQEIPAKVDELTKMIKLDLNLSQDQIASDIDKEVTQITTHSPEAYKYYIEGKQYYNTGNFHKSIESMERAVALDPEFAMAYVVMGIAYYYGLNFYAEGNTCFQKAFELTDRLSERELYVVQGQYYGRQEQTFDKAIEACEKLSELYPDDEFANRAQGWFYLLMEEWDKAIHYLELHIQKKVESAHPYLNLAVAYFAKGLYDKAEDILEYYLNNISDNDAVRRRLARLYVYQGKYDLAFSETEKAFSLSGANYENLRLRGEIYLYTGDLINAEIEYQKLLELGEPTARLYGRTGMTSLYTLQGKFKESMDQAKQGIELSKKQGQKEWESDWHDALASAYLRSGNPGEALKEWNKALDIAVEAEDLWRQKRCLHGKGLTYLEMQSPDMARKTADKLKMTIEQGMVSKHMRYFLHLMGMIEFNRENIPEAIEYFEEAVSLHPNEFEIWDCQALFIDSLAFAYYKHGNLEKAMEEYERITRLTRGRFLYGDVYAKSYYMMGKIYEQKDWKGKAIENYEKFLDLWKNADPGMAEVEDARKSLAGLK